jgi:hypothetical protein
MALLHVVICIRGLGTPSPWPLADCFPEAAPGV